MRHSFNKLSFVHFTSRIVINVKTWYAELKLREVISERRMAEKKRTVAEGYSNKLVFFFFN